MSNQFFMKTNQYVAGRIIRSCSEKGAPSVRKVCVAWREHRFLPFHESLNSIPIVFKTRNGALALNVALKTRQAYLGFNQLDPDPGSQFEWSKVYFFNNQAIDQKSLVMPATISWLLFNTSKPYHSRASYGFTDAFEIIVKL